MKGTIGPYRVSERIGTGGMGEVFKAFDDRLDRWVAIKRIRPGKEDTDENRERFLREARATAALSHSAIVHVYDIFRDGDSDCIVMEFVEGRTLQSLTTTEGPLGALRSIELAKEIAEGLAAAHAKNILHRDLKTENIIVTPDGHGKILDFGLAKPLISNELDSSLTGKGQLVGTSRAMSPEYVGGDTVDHRSDLFALGVLLYETVTGHSPFKAQNTLATLKQVIVHTQPPVRDINPEVPQEFSDLIDKLLEKSPEDRPQSAQEVAIELSRISGQYSSDTIDRTSSSPSHTFEAEEGEWSISTSIMGHPRLRRFWIGVAALILAALAGAYVLGTRERITPSSPEARIRVVLGDFQNKTSDPLLDDSLDIAFRTGLEQSGFIYILSQSELREALDRMQRESSTPIDRKLGIEICQREGAQALVIGTIVRVGPSYSMSAQIIGPQDKSIFTATGTAPTQGEILSSLQRIIRDLRTEFGESLASIESSPPLDKVTTPDLQALKLYYYGAEEHAKGDFEGAISLLEKALERDSEFAMAHAKLGVSYQARGRSDKVLYHLNAAKMYDDRLTESEKLYIDGWLANLQGTTEEMIRSWKEMTALYSDNPSGYQNLGMVHYHYRNQFSEAIETLRNGLLHSDRQRQRGLAHPLGYCELALGNLTEAISAFEENGIQIGLADVFAVQGRYTEAFDMLEASQDNAIMLFKSHYYIDQGQFAKALPLAREAIDLADQENIAGRMLNARLTLVTSLQVGEDSDFGLALEDAFQKADAIYHDESVVRLLTPVPFLATLGKISARKGFLDKAESIYDQIREKAEASGIRLWMGYLKMLEGEILLAKGQGAEAVARLEEAVSFEGPYQAHESLAQALESHGDVARAVQENLWIEQQRGRAFSECYFVCGLRPQNILAWNISLPRLGRLYEASGQPSEAAKYYRRFTERWSNGDPIPLLEFATERLRDLEGRQ